MKSFKYLLVLPFAITALASCNTGNFSPTTPENAIAMVDNYAKSIKNSKASSITVGGHINEIKLKGDATFWSFTEPEESESRSEPVKNSAVQANPLGKMKRQDILGLLSMIPNFSVTDSEIIVDPQDIVSFTLPGSLVSLGEGAIDAEMLLIVANLPKFPMNNNLVKVIRGIDHIPEKLTKEEWDKTELEPWTKAEVKFYADNGRLKITLETDDVVEFFNEINERFGGNSYNADPEPTKKYPGSFSITTNKIGYIDSLSVKFKVDGAKYENVDPKAVKDLYVYLNGDITLDFGLTFKQTVSTPITLKYQLSAYHPTGEGETPDLEYPIVDNGEATKVSLTYDKDKSKPLTTTLDDFKDYLDFDWYKNVERPSLKYDPTTEEGVIPEKYGTLKDTFDDPIFCYNYWNDNAKNIAFTNEIYDALAMPVLDATTKKPKCAILGGIFHEFGVAPGINTHVSTSINGRVVSENGLIKSTDEEGSSEISLKTLNAAGDAVQYVVKDEEKEPNPILMDEIFINSTLLNTEESEYIVNIAIAVLK